MLRAAMDARAYLAEDGPAPDPDAALAGYIDAGLLPAAPTERADYVDYYRAAPEARFLGYPLLAVESETVRGPWLGCCVMDGLAVVVRTEGEDGALEAFAAANACRISRTGDWRLDTYATLGMAFVDPADASLRHLSCRDTDAQGIGS